ncbi:hypothetical protein [Psychroserpens algicola]|uniref:hypothetical protein n=1 Tax=Psychroserpens algicola TaxID=1719034 RepID=UPI001953E2EC|nr:hypothetical protein [Psychroserpens algicola]
MKFRIVNQSNGNEIAVLNLQSVPRKGDYLKHGNEVYVILKIMHHENLITLKVTPDTLGYDELTVEWD